MSERVREVQNTKQPKLYAKQQHWHYGTTRCISRSEKIEQRWQAATNEKERIGGAQLPRLAQLATLLFPSPQPSLDASPRPVRRQWQIAQQREYCGGHLCIVRLAHIFVCIH